MKSIEYVTVASVKNQSVTRRMQLDIALRYPKKWRVVNNIEPEKTILPEDVKIVVAVIVHDRFDNIKEWVRCWSMCDTTNAQLVVIHNYDSQQAKEAYAEFLMGPGITHIPRENIGYDIGAFQDVCRNRMAGFPDFDYLIWCTDDTLPMRKDFIHNLASTCKGVSCMEISEEVKRHIRTTGFCISKQTASKIQFPADPVITKEQCYHFEHRGHDAFYEQVKKLGLPAVQVTDIKVSPLWDSGQVKARRPNNRKEEHYTLFPIEKQSDKKVTFISLIYNSYPEILSSLINQTHNNWELILIHDGPETYPVKKIVDAAGDNRVKYIQTKERKGSWGHFWRGWALNELKAGRLSAESDFVVITNADNHYVPVFSEYMIRQLELNTNAVAAYCSQMVHSYTASNVIDCKPKQGYIDCGSVMVKRDVACQAGWRDAKSHSSDWLYFEDIIKTHGIDKFIPVKGCLMVHN